MSELDKWRELRRDYIERAKNAGNEYMFAFRIE